MSCGKRTVFSILLIVSFVFRQLISFLPAYADGENPIEPIVETAADGEVNAGHNENDPYISDISTDDKNAITVEAESGGTVEVAHEGNIETSGENNDGIEISSGGSESVVEVTNEGTISTEGSESAGISVTVEDGGSASVEQSGDISTSGDDSPAVEVSVSGGESGASVVVEGNISTEGSDSAGISVTVEDGGRASVEQSGDISTSGNDSLAVEVSVSGDESEASVVVEGNISTEGSDSEGISVTVEDGGSASVEQSGDISTSGNDSPAVEVSVSGGESEASVVVEGNISTEGSDSAGISVTVKDGGSASVEQSGDISVIGLGQKGEYLNYDNFESDIVENIPVAININASGDGSKVTVNHEGTIETEGKYADAITVTTENNSTVEIEQKGDIILGAQGTNINGEKYGSTININAKEGSSVDLNIEGNINYSGTVALDYGEYKHYDGHGSIIINNEGGTVNTTFGNFLNDNNTGDNYWNDNGLFVSGNGTTNVTAENIEGNIRVNGSSEENKTATVTVKDVVGGISVNGSSAVVNAKSVTNTGESYIQLQDGGTLNVEEGIFTDWYYGVLGDGTLNGTGENLTVQGIIFTGGQYPQTGWGIYGDETLTITNQYKQDDPDQERNITTRGYIIAESAEDYHTQINIGNAPSIENMPTGENIIITGEIDTATHNTRGTGGGNIDINIGYETSGDVILNGYSYNIYSRNDSGHIDIDIFGNLISENIGVDAGSQNIGAITEITINGELTTVGNTINAEASGDETTQTKINVTGNVTSSKGEAININATGGSVDISIGENVIANSSNANAAVEITNSAKANLTVGGDVVSETTAIIIDQTTQNNDSLVDILVEGTISGSGDSAPIKVSETTTPDNLVLTVWKIETDENGTIAETTSGTAATEIEESINYIIKIESPSVGSLKPTGIFGTILNQIRDKYVAKQDDIVYLNTEDGYTITAAYNGTDGSKTDLLQDEDGRFYVKVPKGGGVYLSATLEKTVEPTPEPTQELTPEPTAEPTQEPPAEPTQESTPEPTLEPPAEPTQDPTPESTQETSAEPTSEPTIEPTTQDPSQEFPPAPGSGPEPGDHPGHDPYPPYRPGPIPPYNPPERHPGELPPFPHQGFLEKMEHFYTEYPGHTWAPLVRSYYDRLYRWYDNPVLYRVWLNYLQSGKIPTPERPISQPQQEYDLYQLLQLLILIQNQMNSRP